MHDGGRVHTGLHDRRRWPMPARCLATGADGDAHVPHVTSAAVRPPILSASDLLMLIEARVPKFRVGDTAHACRYSRRDPGRMVLTMDPAKE